MCSRAWLFSAQRYSSSASKAAHGLLMQVLGVGNGCRPGAVLHQFCPYLSMGIGIRGEDCFKALPHPTVSPIWMGTEECASA